MSAEENKTIVAVFDAHEQTIETYDQVSKELESAGAGSPKGRLYHVVCSKEGGTLIVDVWESVELLDQFSQTLVPILNNLGVTPIEPQINPVINIVKG